MALCGLIGSTVTVKWYRIGIGMVGILAILVLNDMSGSPLTEL